MFLRVALTASLSVGVASLAQAQEADMSFFITSTNPGEGANLGGLEGADAYCSTLAEATGSTGKTWKAYLSSSTENARDRIGSGPWQNAEGVVVAESVEQLHSDENNLTKETALSEAGEMINGRGDEPNRHDVLTGSGLDGTLMGEACRDWTSTSADSSAMVGHHDRIGGGDHPTAWNAAHASKGCSLDNLRETGGDGLFYCFAAD